MIDNFLMSHGATQRRHGKMLANLKEAAQWAFDFRIFHRLSQRRLVAAKAGTPSHGGMLPARSQLGVDAL